MSVTLTNKHIFLLHLSRSIAAQLNYLAANLTVRAVEVFGHFGDAVRRLSTIYG
jgi:hypothetical protein